MFYENIWTWINGGFAINRHEALLNSVLPFLWVGIFGAAIFPRKVLQEGQPTTAFCNLGKGDGSLNTRLHLRILECI